MGKIYKYLGYDVLKLALSEPGLCSFRCSYPADFNDPYELFLTIDFQRQPPEILAYYQDVIGELPQFPVTCFSIAPDVVPMWAHYGHSGLDHKSAKDRPYDVDLGAQELVFQMCWPRG